MPEAPVFTRLPGISDFSVLPGVLHAPKGVLNTFYAHLQRFLVLFNLFYLLFDTLISTVSECSETVGGLLCGQQGFMQNNTHYTPLAFTREVIAFYTVIITLNNP